MFVILDDFRLSKTILKTIVFRLLIFRVKSKNRFVDISILNREMQYLHSIYSVKEFSTKFRVNKTNLISCGMFLNEIRACITITWKSRWCYQISFFYLFFSFFGLLV